MGETKEQPKIDNKTKRIIIAFALFAIGVFLSISFFSFFFTWQNDQSELLNKTTSEILFSDIDDSDPALSEAAPIEIQNKGYKLGAIVSKKFIHDWFGIGSFAIIFLCFFFTLYFFDIKFIKDLDIKRYLFVPISLMLLCSINFGFFFNDIWDGNIGGCFGYYLSYQFLRRLLGVFVTGLVIILIDCSYVLLTFKKVLPAITEKIQQYKTQHEAANSTEAPNENEPSVEAKKEENSDNNETESLQTESEVPEQTAQQEPETLNFTQPIEPELNTEFSQYDLNNQEENNESPIDTNQNEEKDFELEISQESENTENQYSEENDEEQENEISSESEFEKNNDEDQENEQSLDPNDTDETDDAQTNNIIEPTVESEKEDLQKIGNMQITNTNTAVQDTSEIEMVMQDYDPKADLSHFKQPGIDLLKIYDNDKQAVQVDEDEQLANKNLIESTLLSFGVEIESITATVGPTITLYEIVPKAGTRITKIQTLEKDIMMSLSALGIRIIAPIPGKGTVGIEVPNKKRQTVSMYSVINSQAFKESKMELPVALGKTITNDVYMFDLAKMPHLLVAGATGQGKSVGLNAIVTSLLYKKHPSQLKFVLVDPKMVEFSIYGGLIRHYMAQYPGEDNIILTDCAKVLQTLKSLVQEMEDRYKLLMDAHCRNIIEYNEKFIHRELNPNKGHKYLCYMVIIIDEFGDFIMQAGKEIETPIARIAQKARAVGMHLILATQRPSVNVITGIIKANIPGRIAFRTSSGVDSKTILDAYGAEGLVGKGDLLVSNAGAAPERVQCAFVDTPEVERIVNFISKQQGYGEPLQLPEVKDQNADIQQSSSAGSNTNEALDPIFEEAAKLIVNSNSGSTSAIQRYFSVGYNRAGRIMDQLQANNIVGQYNGSKAREVLVDAMGLDQILNDLRQKGKL